MISNYKLLRMKRDDLLRTAAALGCDIAPDALRPAIIKAIQAKQQGSGRAEVVPIITRTPGNPQTFDALTMQPAAGESENSLCADLREETSGDGPGRKRGISNEQCKIDNLPKEPNRAIEYYAKYFFKVWSKLSGCDEIALDAEELREFSVDTTQFLEYHGIKIPQGLAVDSKFIVGGAELVVSRVAMHKVHKARIKAQQEKEQQKAKEDQNV